ncbi:hypothetical protein QJS10_CPA06g00043 [Acorus calamus]|uniref:Uncharacterized protein n=1 Tax=Acorus calamus TaxID=4465 RepID=A0AAV9EP92_ACOCL|nr:hypothetical protein QJS10_CPA06g00043 [Acorus calamus]
MDALHLLKSLRHVTPPKPAKEAANLLQRANATGHEQNRVSERGWHRRGQLRRRRRRWRRERRGSTSSRGGKKMEKYKSELSKGYWYLGAWRPLAISGHHRARIRKEALLAGEDWPYDPERGEMRNVRKGHKCDRISAEKRAHTAELMKKMPDMLLAYKD